MSLLPKRFGPIEILALGLAYAIELSWAWLGFGLSSSFCLFIVVDLVVI